MQGVPPATVAEFTFEGDGNQDFYDGMCPELHGRTPKHDRVWQSLWWMATICP